MSLRGGVIDDEAIFSPEIQGLLRRRTPRNDKKMSFATISNTRSQITYNRIVSPFMTIDFVSFRVGNVKARETTRVPGA